MRYSPPSRTPALSITLVQGAVPRGALRDGLVCVRQVRAVGSCQRRSRRKCEHKNRGQEGPGRAAEASSSAFISDPPHAAHRNGRDARVQSPDNASSASRIVSSHPDPAWTYIAHAPGPAARAHVPGRRAHPTRHRTCGNNFKGSGGDQGKLAFDRVDRRADCSVRCFRSRASSACLTSSRQQAAIEELYRANRCRRWRLLLIYVVETGLSHPAQPS